MNMRAVVAFLVAALLSVAAFAQSATAPAQRPGDIGQRWQIGYQRTSQSDGEIRWLVWQHDEEAPTEVVIPVKKGDTANRIAVTSRDAFRDKLENRYYNVNIAKGNVWITAKRGERRFALQLAGSTASGVDIDTYREGR
jgi:hypothetical protein